MFFKKELQMAGDQAECDRIKKMLENAGIKYSVVNKAAGAVRGGGGSDQFQILVKRKDFTKARSLFKF